MAEKMSRKFAWGQYLKEFGVYVGVVAGILVILGVVQIFLVGADWKNWLDFITKNLAIVIGIVSISVFILFADRVLLRYFLHRSKIDTI
jgi:fumarate reductase subunit C